MLEDIRRSLVYALGWMIIGTVAALALHITYAGRAGLAAGAGIVIFGFDLGFRRRAGRRAS